MSVASKAFGRAPSFLHRGIGVHTAFGVNILLKSLWFPSPQRGLGSRLGWLNDSQPARKRDPSLRWGDEFILIASRRLLA